MNAVDRLYRHFILMRNVIWAVEELSQQRTPASMRCVGYLTDFMHNLPIYLLDSDKTKQRVFERQFRTDFKYLYRIVPSHIVRSVEKVVWSRERLPAGWKQPPSSVMEPCLRVLQDGFLFLRNEGLAEDISFSGTCKTTADVLLEVLRGLLEWKSLDEALWKEHLLALIADGPVDHVRYWLSVLFPEV